MPILEIAEKIKNKIIELGGKLAFPTNLSINEKTAHYTTHLLMTMNQLQKDYLRQTSVHMWTAGVRIKLSQLI